MHLGDIQPRIHVRVDVQIPKLPGCTQLLRLAQGLIAKDQHVVLLECGNDSTDVVLRKRMSKVGAGYLTSK